MPDAQVAPAVERAVDPEDRPRGADDQRVDPRRIGGCDRQADPADVGPGRQARRELAPVVPAVGREVHAARGTAVVGLVPRAAALPHRSEDPVRVLRVDRDVDRPRVVLQVENLAPVRAAVDRAVEPAMLVQIVQPADRGDEDPVRIDRIDGELADAAHLGQPEIAPAGSPVDRAQDALAVVGVAAAGLLAGADVDDVRVRRMGRDRADRERGLVGIGRRPGRSAVFGEEDAAFGRTEPDPVVVVRVDGERGDPSADVHRPRRHPASGGRLQAGAPDPVDRMPPRERGQAALLVDALHREPGIGDPVDLRRCGVREALGRLRRTRQRQDHEKREKAKKSPHGEPSYRDAAATSSGVPDPASMSGVMPGREPSPPAGRSPLGPREGKGRPRGGARHHGSERDRGGAGADLFSFYDQAAHSAAIGRSRIHLSGPDRRAVELQQRPGHQGLNSTTGSA